MNYLQNIVLGNYPQNISIRSYLQNISLEIIPSIWPLEINLGILSLDSVLWQRDIERSFIVPAYRGYFRYPRNRFGNKSLSVDLKKKYSTRLKKMANYRTNTKFSKKAANIQQKLSVSSYEGYVTSCPQNIALKILVLEFCLYNIAFRILSLETCPQNIVLGMSTLHIAFKQYTYSIVHRITSLEYRPQNMVLSLLSLEDYPPQNVVL